MLVLIVVVVMAMDYKHDHHFVLLDVPRYDVIVEIDDEKVCGVTDGCCLKSYGP